MEWPPFYRTKMGEKFYCKTVPDLIKAVERLADRLAEQAPPQPTEVDDLLLATDGLVNAIEEVFNAEIVPGSDATARTSKNLRARADVARKAADAIR